MEDTQTEEPYSLFSLSSGSLQHLWDGGWSSAGPLLSGDVLSLGKPYSESFHFFLSPYSLAFANGYMLVNEMGIVVTLSFQITLTNCTFNVKPLVLLCSLLRGQ